MSRIPIFVVFSPRGQSNAGNKREALIQSCMDSPCVDGFYADAPWVTPSDEGVFDELADMINAAPVDLKFGLRPLMCPVPAGVPSFQNDPSVVGKLWDTAFQEAAIGFTKDAINEVVVLDSLDTFDGITMAPTPAYAFDCEQGVKTDTVGGHSKQNAAIAAAGYTPDGYLSGLTAFAKFLNAESGLAGRTVRFAWFMPGFEPAIDDNGNVTNDKPSDQFARQQAAMFKAVFTNCNFLPVYTVFDGTTPIPQFWIDIGNMFGGLGLQLTPKLDQDGVTKAFVAAAAITSVPIVRIEPHDNQVAFLPAAITAAGL